MQQVIKKYLSLLDWYVSVFPLRRNADLDTIIVNTTSTTSLQPLELQGVCDYTDVVYIRYVRVLVVERGSQKQPKSAGDLPDEDDFRRSGAG
jgi:hypothetical protein